jgi:membrane protein
MRTSNGLLSIGFVLALIAASNAFAVMSTLLNTIYDVKQGPGFWRNRLSAIGITIVVGAMMFTALSAMLLGPHFGRELERVFGVSHTFTIVWPTLRWVLAVTGALASIEVLYYLGVSRKHSLRQQLPGSVFAVTVWILSSGIMGIYFRRFSYINAMYGTLASVIILAVWLQITAIALLLGAELNVEVERVGATSRG